MRRPAPPAPPHVTGGEVGLEGTGRHGLSVSNRLRFTTPLWGYLRPSPVTGFDTFVAQPQNPNEILQLMTRQARYRAHYQILAQPQ